MRPVARRRRVVRFARASALSLAVTATFAQGQTVIEPFVEAGIGYIDNVTLVRDGDSQDQLNSFAFEIAPGIDIAYGSPRARASLGYRFQYLNYYSDIDENRSYHQLNANGTVSVLPDWFLVSARANYGQVIEDADGAVNYNNLFVTNNQRDVFSGSITPTLRHDFGRVTAEASYLVGFVDYKGGNAGQPGAFNDTDEYRFDAGIFSSDRTQRFVWALRYSSSETRYDDSSFYLPFKYDRAWADLAYAISRTVRLVGEFGYESDLVGDSVQPPPVDPEDPDPGDPVGPKPIDTRDGGLDETFWSAGLRWEPDERTSVEARTGDRFFGTSYFFEARRQARQLEFRALYREEPTTNTQRRVTGNPIPGADDDNQFSDPFVLTEFRGTLTLDGRRTRVALDLFEVERDYLYFVSDETRTGVNVNVTRDFSATMRLNLNLSSEDVDRASRSVERADSDHRLNRFTAELTRELGSRSELTAVAGFNQKTDAGEQNYDGAWIGVRYRYEF